MGKAIIQYIFRSKIACTRILTKEVMEKDTTFYWHYDLLLKAE